MTESMNVHVYPAPIVNESRIFRETKAVAEAGLFERIVVTGQRAAGLPDVERLDEVRSIERVGSVADERPRSIVGRIREQISWSVATYRRWRSVPRASSTPIRWRCCLCVMRSHAAIAPL